MGISQPNYSHMKRKTTPLREHHMVLLQLKLGASRRWLLTGEGPMEVEKTHTPQEIDKLVEERNRAIEEKERCELPPPW